MAKDSEKIAQPSGTFYSPDTPQEVINILELYRGTNVRLRLHWGDRETGQDWGDLYDVSGRIGRSTGPRHIPILCHNANSMGGGAILDDCIVRIRFANKRDGGDLYVHPTYQPPSRDYWIGGTGSEAEYEKHFPPVTQAYAV